ncbi:MAG: hypothetical protein ABI874_09615, partial [Chloroflexota bacterium]
MTILGGIGTLWGSIIGAGIFLLLRDWLSSSAQSASLPIVGDWLKALADAPLVITGGIFIIIVLNFRHGIWGTLQRWQYGLPLLQISARGRATSKAQTTSALGAADIPKPHSAPPSSSDP